jgi:hypothetical protein
MRLVICLLLFTFLAFPQDNTFEHIYDQFDRCYSADQDNEGGYIFAADPQPGGVSKSVLVKIDSTGRIIWEKSSGYIINNSVIVRNSPDHSYVYCYTEDPGGGKLIKFSYDGDTLWSKNYDYGISAFTINSSSEILTVSQYNFILVVTNNNSEGETLWSRQIGNGINILTPPDVVRNDSVIYISADKKLFKLSAAGELIWEKNYKDIIRGLALSDQNVHASMGNILSKLSFDGDLIKQTRSCRKLKYLPATGMLVILDTGILRIVSEEGLIYNWINYSGVLSDISVTENGILFSGSDHGARLLKTDFNLYYQGIAIISPSTNFNIVAGTESQIIYRAANITPPALLEYSTDQGNKWNVLSSDINFTVPVMITDDFLIRLSSSERKSLERNLSIGPGSTYEYINVNNVMMWINNYGIGSYDPRTGGNGYYWPDNSKSAIFSDGLIYGGKINGNPRVNGSFYNTGIIPGLILSDGTADKRSRGKYGIWKLLHNWENLPEGPERERYQLVHDRWPAEMGAPFSDLNNDGYYTRGIDKPGIGDETLFYVSNDMDSLFTKGAFDSQPLGIQFQTTVFGFNQNNPLQDVVYKKYILINKSGGSIEDMYLGYWADPDLGDASDDYVGSDSAQSLAYCYNAYSSDGIYGSPPPAAGHRIIQGPRVPSLSSDSALFNGRWIKGFRNLEATSFIFIMKLSGYQYIIPHFYNFLQGLKFDGSPVINPITNTPTKFYLNGNPNTGTGWYEGEGWPGGPPPFDRRYMISTGPFNMAPGDTQEIVIAIAAALGNDNKHSIEVLKNVTAFADNYYKVNAHQWGSGSLPPEDYLLYQNYPNPFNNSTAIDFQIPVKSFVKLSVYDITGQKIADLINNEMEAGKHKIIFNKRGLASGIYFYRLTTNERTFIKKMMLLK